MNTFERTLAAIEREGIHCVDLATVQVNVGLKCNLSCAHCHVGSNPDREEVMSWRTMETILDKTRSLEGALFDITGGSPELNPELKRFIPALRERGNRVQVRTNLTILAHTDQSDTPGFFRDYGVELVGSMPCYLEENVRAQRGNGVYETSIRIIKRLNQLGYGVKEELPLSLVYNPGGPFLPPDQRMLEQAYRDELIKRFDIRFTRLLTITNMPIGRFLDDLIAEGRDGEYDELLKKSFNPDTVDGLMCRHQICIGWDGTLSDCDFNQALAVKTGYGAPAYIDDFDNASLVNRRIVTGDYCFGCTAGCGSSCTGALVDPCDSPKAATG